MTLNHTDHILSFLLSESSKVEPRKDGATTNTSRKCFPLIPPPSLGGRQALVVTKPLAVCSYPAGALRFQPVNIPGSVLALPWLS
ncbi:hypothetical protein EYF80_060843 [Liparis tanakae]|uniref:Uncharacterized protein n=1 Tax=Liparis tanakae TaxID=230148 RepID=A0A4Z2EKB7_9TELE|nr:hypothetical protein EYF80_060843 [Liparis tanakae]